MPCDRDVFVIHYRCHGFTVADLQGLTHALCKAFPLDAPLEYSEEGWLQVTCSDCKKMKGREVNYLPASKEPDEILTDASCEVARHALIGEP